MSPVRRGAPGGDDEPVNQNMELALRPPLVGILRGIRPDEVVEHVDVLASVGLGAIEIPLNSHGWQETIERLVGRYGRTLRIGGGTVSTPEQASQLRKLGARLMLTPHVDPSLIRHAADLQLFVMAGVATATEAFSALRAGAHALKLFPAATLGPQFAHAIRAVLPHDAPMFAVGGVTPANLGEYLRAGCAGAGLGSSLYRPGQDASRTRAMAQAYIDAYAEAAA